MLKNVIALLLRSISKYPTQYLPNIFGLSIAFLSLLTIFLSLQRETSYDAFHTNGSDIYRVNYDETVSGIEGARHLATTGPQVAKGLVDRYPEVKMGTRIRHQENNLFTYKETSFFEKNLFYVDPEFLQMFSFPLQEGDPSTALLQPNSIILTHQMALKYFGTASPMNKTMLIDGANAFIVTGVLAPLPETSSLAFDFLVPFEAFKVPAGYPVTLESWGWISFYNYIQLHPGNDPKLLEEKLPEFASSHFNEQRASKFRYRLQPLNEIYFGSVHSGDFPQGNFNYVLILLAVGLSILFVAAFNFINLSIVMGTIRSRELGMKKVLGAGKYRIAIQFGLEFMILSVASMLFAVFALSLFAAQVSTIFAVPLSYLELHFFTASLYVGALAVMLGFFAGVYPVLLTSRLSLNQIIKGTVLSGNSSLGLRNTLIGLQFLTASALIFVSIVVFNQYSFIGNKDLGFNKEKVLIMKMDREVLSSMYQQIDHRLKEVPGVLATGISGEALDGDQGSVPFNLDEADDEQIFPINIYGIRPGWVETMGIELISGRNLRTGHQPDSTSGILINETTLNILGLTADEAIGKKAQVGDIIEGEIIGVVKDFHFSSLHSEINPLALFVPRTFVDKVFVRYDVPIEGEADFIKNITAKWAEIAPSQPLDMTPLKANLNALYAKDTQFGQLIYFFCLISILISGIGLYGIVEFHVRRKLKEVGVRKILGANVYHIFANLSGAFLLIVVFASGVGLLGAYFIMSEWLSNFAYQIDISMQSVVLAGVIILSISLVTITIQVLKALRLNPLTVIRED
jgi:putative ABC transport system permease protein